MNTVKKSLGFFCYMVALCLFATIAVIIDVF